MRNKFVEMNVFSIKMRRRRCTEHADSRLNGTAARLLLNNLPRRCAGVRLVAGERNRDPRIQTPIPGMDNPRGKEGEGETTPAPPYLSARGASLSLILSFSTSVLCILIPQRIRGR